MNVENNEEFQELINNNDTVLVDFWAAWCGPCRMVGPVIDEIISSEPENFKVAKVDVTEAADIATKYGIRNIPTVLLFKNGEPADKLVGVNSKEAYLKLAESSN